MNRLFTALATSVPTLLPSTFQRPGNARIRFRVNVPTTKGQSHRRIGAILLRSATAPSHFDLVGARFLFMVERAISLRDPAVESNDDRAALGKMTSSTSGAAGTLLLKTPEFP